MDYVLLHGTTQSPEGWGRLATALQDRGHRALCVDFPTDQPDLPAARYARIAAEQVHADNPVVVAHSGAGLLLPAVAGALGASRLVWLAAAVPGPVSFREEIQDHGDEMATPEWRGAGPELLDDPVAAAYFLFHDCDLATLRWALTTRRLFYPAAVYDERVTGDRPPSTFVLPTADRTLRPTWLARTARERLGVDPVEIDAGHCPHVSVPDRLAEIIASQA
ncbi:MAG TPA: alpha/beta hydrolase [Amycolatopsis sp.]|nr:alpha/beta hydrolase [Amycolatopsis sp.]